MWFVGLSVTDKISLNWLQCQYELTSLIFEFLSVDDVHTGREDVQQACGMLLRHELYECLMTTRQRIRVTATTHASLKLSDREGR